MERFYSIDPADYEWRPCSIVIPRFGLVLGRKGTHWRLILPGRYMTRRSRTLGRWLYRHCEH